MTRKSLLLIPALTAAALANGQLVDFNTVGQFTGGFAGSSGFAEVASGGLGGSGAVSMGGTSAVAVYQTGFNPSTLNGATFSAFFQYNGADGDGGTGRGFSVGFTSGAGDTYSSSAATTGTDFRAVVAGAGTGNNYGVDLLNNGTTFEGSSKDITLTVGNWYQLVLTIGGVSGGNFTGVTGALYSADSNGGSLSVLKFLNGSGSGYTEANSLASASEAFAFFGGQNPSQRISGLADNFSASPIPEPSTYAALTGLLALGMIVARRRRR